MKLGSIQLLRAVAAILVAYCHSVDLQTHFSHSRQQDFLHLQNFGAFGLDIFFVISGFIICYSADKYSGPRDGLTFLRHRAKRLLPLYYAVTLLYFLILWAVYRTPHIPWISSGMVIKSIALLPFTDHTYWINHLLFLAWTLCFEWIFYLLFFLTILSGTHDKPRFLHLIMTGLLIMGPTFGVLFHWTALRWLFFTNPIMLEFLMGVFIYQCYQAFSVSVPIARLLLAAGIGACLGEIVVGYSVISEFGSTLDWSQPVLRCLLWGLPATAIVGGILFLEKRGKLAYTRTNRTIALLGNASYALYLSSAVTYAVMDRYYTSKGFPFPPDLAIFVQLLIAIAVGIGVHYWIEKPLARLSLSGLFQRRQLL